MKQLLFALLLPSLALANDSTAVLAAGGLRLEKSEQIALRSEKLRISPQRIVVDYEMENISAAAVDTLLAFPLPLLEGPELANIPVGIEPADAERFLDFRTTVDGVAVAPQQEVKAYQMLETGALGAEVTAELRAAGLLISPLNDELFERLNKLPSDALKRLADAKLVDVFDHDTTHTVTPLWAVQYTYFSKQRFEPGRVVRVHHEYTPVVGRASLSQHGIADELKHYCVDKPTEKALRSAIAKQVGAHRSSARLETKEVEYVLKTGANWAGPIGTFELSILKERSEQLVSTCLAGLERVSEKGFRMSVTNFTPTQDLAIVFIEPSAAE